MRPLTIIINREIGDVTGWTTNEIYNERRDYATVEKEHRARRFIRSLYFPTKSMLVARLKDMGYILRNGYWWKKI